MQIGAGDVEKLALQTMALRSENVELKQRYADLQVELSQVETSLDAARDILEHGMFVGRYLTLVRLPWIRTWLHLYAAVGPFLAWIPLASSRALASWVP